LPSISEKEVGFVIATKGSVWNKAKRTAQQERRICVDGRVQGFYHGRKQLLKAAGEGGEDSS